MGKTPLRGSEGKSMAGLCRACLGVSLDKQNPESQILVLHVVHIKEQLLLS